MYYLTYVLKIEYIDEVNKMDMIMSYKLAFTTIPNFKNSSKKLRRKSLALHIHVRNKAYRKAYIESSK